MTSSVPAQSPMARPSHPPYSPARFPAGKANSIIYNHHLIQDIQIGNDIFQMHHPLIPLKSIKYTSAQRARIHQKQFDQEISRGSSPPRPIKQLACSKQSKLLNPRAIFDFYDRFPVIFRFKKSLIFFGQSIFSKNTTGTSTFFRFCLSSHTLKSRSERKPKMRFS